ncbi:B3 domain-containing protein Os04g0386900-like isoform X2 [Tasmannia lanceolata]|uniref:B3 domain-containing protein Os04g0386900-like isoform X1 n=1 Tax=Tasmannia lanceolata TaxID=3420 RepID=UPI004063B996
MTDPLVRDPNVQDEHYEIPLKENNNYCAYIDRFVSSSISSRGEAKDEPYVRSTISMGSITSAEQDEILPLTGKPYFVSILPSASVKSPYQMVVPNRMSRLLPSALVPTVLYCRNKKWEVLYYGDRPFKRFTPSWRKFATDNKLKVGDACVFELIGSKKLEFRVQILDGKFPPAVVSSEGQSAADPIIIE